jgi:hypothetical protein
MGGKHGPYRRFDDASFPIHQLSDEDKQWVDKDAMAKAKTMAKEKLQQLLEDIQMGKADFEVKISLWLFFKICLKEPPKVYTKMLLRVADEIKSIGVVIEGLAASTQRRPWILNTYNVRTKLDFVLEKSDS